MQISKIQNYINLFDFGDLRLFFIIGKKNIKNLIFLPFLFSIIIYIISLNLEKKYLSTATLVISPEENNKIVNIEDVYSIESIQNRVNNQIAILKSDEVADYIVKDKKNILQFEKLYSSQKKNFFKRIFLKKQVIDSEALKEILKRNFKVTNIPRSDVLQLSFTSSNPKISQLALQSIINSYQRYEIDSKIKITSYANQKIAERLEDLVKQMDAAQKKLSIYKKENKLIDTGNVKQLKINEIEAISNRILEAEKKLQEQQNDLLSIKVADGDIDALLAIKDLSNREEITNIKNSLSANENNIQSLLLIYTDKHPKVTQAYQQNESLKSQLVNLLDKNIEQKAYELGNLQSFINLSEEELNKATNELRDVEEKEAGMLKYSREVESSRNLYENFLQRVKETNEAQNLQLSSIKIIETPFLPTKHIFPKQNQYFIISFIVSLLIIYGLVFYKELSLSVVKSPEALDYLNLNQIAVLPKVENLKKGYHILQIFVENSESNFSEAIRSARANVESKFKTHSSYLVTSSNPSEGKTSFSFNLALSLERNYKVLFIEADIRRPSVLNSFYKFDKVIHGLGEILSGTKNLDETVFKVPATSLDIITSGEKRFDMSDIVNKDQMKKFFDLLKITYDYVIIDSPPVQPVSDTLILSQAVDYNLFVIRSDTTRTSSVISSIKKIQNVGSKINGLILNDLDTSKDSYYSYYYNYSPDYYSKS